MKTLKGLIDEVVTQGRCTSCGGCVGLCPHVCFVDGRVIWTDACTRDQGRCHDICPWVIAEERGIQGDAIGSYKAIYQSRAKSAAVQDKGQYGGTIIALVLLAMEEGLIDKAILTSGEANGAPRGRVVQEPSEVLRCSGSRYVAAGTLEAFNRAVKEEAIACGVVGLPCQVTALRNVQTSSLSHSQHKDSISLVLGLFCTWALDYRQLQKFFHDKGLDGVQKRYDIPPPPANVFRVITESEVIDFPLDLIRPMIMPGCGFCADMTAEAADVSVGAMEGMEGWNTLVVRTERGEDLVRLAESKGVLELETMPEENLAHLKEASIAKRKRGLARRADHLGDTEEDARHRP